MRFDDALQRIMAAPPPAEQAAMAIRAGLIGRGIQGSRSPLMHETEGARLGLPYSYTLLDFDGLELADADLPAFLSFMAESGFAGLNVTHPFKERVLPHLDALSPEAKGIGAVNTITFRDGASIGHNTDCWGFAESFRRRMADVPRRRVVMAGAGGAGLAVGRALLDLHVDTLVVHDLDPSKVQRLIDTLSAPFGPGRVRAATHIETALATAHGFVNATPMGMAKYPGLPIPAASLRADLWVADIVYFPAETALLQAAAAKGCRVLPGAGMAIFQAVRAFELITGHAPDAEAMARHFAAFAG